MTEDRHRGLKRWERAKQLTALDAEPNLVGPLAWCKVQFGVGMDKDFPDQVEKIPVYIVRVFAKDFVCVKAYSGSIPGGLPGPMWLVRGGIDWQGYFRLIVRHYANGMEVPDSFKPQKKIRPEIIRKMEALPDEALPSIFSKFREVGVLAALPQLERATCPNALNWDTLRTSFQDFQETTSVKDNPLP